MHEANSDHSIGFLIADVGRLLRKRFDQRARDLGLTRSQWQVLALLARNEGLNQAAIADLLDIEPITLSRQIDRMQQAGWVVRTADPSDRRVRLLRMTDQARDILDRMRTIGRCVIDEALEGLSGDEIQHMTQGLEQLRTTLSGKPAPAEAPAVSSTPPSKRAAR
jgi:MarR family transcriptional regulator for hemolysin